MLGVTALPPPPPPPPHAVKTKAMNKKFTNTPIFIYFILASVSAVSALVFFHLGGSLAEFTGQSEPDSKILNPFLHAIFINNYYPNLTLDAVPGRC